ncbi:ribosome maturation factor RimM [Corynebacterium sp. MNWGS58]|uniref:ribosome maturation factor RimM n=1 Tax=Corynebacterium sp. 102791.4 TaxID=3104612 RepID=UPI00351951D0
MDVRIGRVIKTHGIRGEVVVDATTDDPEGRFSPETVVDGRQAGRTQSLRITGARPHKGRWLISFAEITDRTHAESLRGMEFFAPADESDDDGYYDHDLEGLRVWHEGTAIGEVTGVVETINRSLLEIALDNGRDALVPFVDEFIAEVDLDAETIMITPPEGLLDL